jgi:hypothetical protein
MRIRARRTVRNRRIRVLKTEDKKDHSIENSWERPGTENRRQEESGYGEQEGIEETRIRAWLTVMNTSQEGSQGMENS